MSDFVCEPLGNQHDRALFDCGVSILNDYLAKYAKQDVKRKASAVFVLVHRAEPRRVIGFYTLCATSVSLSELPQAMTKKLPRYPEIPAVLLGRLARDIHFPGVGELLLAAPDAPASATEADDVAGLAPADAQTLLLPAVDPADPSV